MIAIRPATTHDLVAVVEIERASFPDPWSAGSFRSLIGHPLAAFLVAAEDRGVAGYAVLLCALDEAELANLAVAAGRRRCGVGAGLLDAVIAEARGRGTSTIFLEVRDSNAAARALYRSRGFTEVGRRRRYYRQPAEDAIVMRCAVGEPRTDELVQGN